MTRVLFLPCYLDGLSPLSASVRFRAQWPAKYWDEADCYDGRQRLADYDVFVFQKFYLSQRARDWVDGFRAQGKLLVLDMCDADWVLSDTHRERLLTILPKFHFATVTTEPMKEWLSRWLPTYIIPDRLDLEFHTERHEPKPGKPSLIWFGFSGNLPTLGHIWCDLKPILDQHNLDLTILADKMPVKWECRRWGNDWRCPKWVPWTLAGANAEIARHDIALNPRLNAGRFAFKSDNKTITAWALGVPVARTAQQLVELLNYETRIEEAKQRMEEVRKLWDVRLSVADWKERLEHFQANIEGVKHG